MNNFDLQTLRPEDFRKAWVNAYRDAVVMVLGMTEAGNNQLRSIHAMQAWAAQQNKDGVEGLKSARAELETTLHVASQSHLQMLKDAVNQYSVAMNKLLERERDVMRTLHQTRQSLDAEREAFQAEQRAWITRPIWRRLWWAIWPR